MQALRLQYDDHRIQAVLAAAAWDLSELKTSSEKNRAETKDAINKIMDRGAAGSLNAVAIMQKLYVIDEKVNNNGEKQNVFGENLIITQQEFQAAREDRSAREKSQSDIRALGEAVRIMSEGQQCQLDKVTRRLEEMMRV